MNSYSSVSLGTWSYASDVDTFFSRFNHSNNYNDGNTQLRVGNYVIIQDGTYNGKWIIAGFDLEYNSKASDNTIYNNGYGIALIPSDILITGKWNTSSTLAGAYKSSYMHNTVLPGIVTKLQNVLGSHIVQRNVLLSSSVGSNGYSNAYTWTTAYATLMSVGQIIGTFAMSKNKYDDGEANYKLPIFNSQSYACTKDYWTRNVFGYYGSSNTPCSYRINANGGLSVSVTDDIGVRPLIYLR